MREIKKYIIVLLVMVFNYLNTVFAVELNDKTTIKELSQKVKTINQLQDIEEQKLISLKKGLVINKFFKTNLLDNEKKKLDEIILEYKKNKKELLEKLNNINNSKETIKELLENEKNIYKKLLLYIQKDKYEEYKDFIKKDLELVKNKLFLESDKIENKELLNEKLNKIKKQIIKHKQVLKRKIDKVIRIKIEEKLEKFIKKQKFQRLKLEQKKLVFDKMINRLKSKLEKLDKKNIKLVKIYKLIIENMASFKETLK